MYVTEFNADVARIAWRVPAGHFEEAPLPAFREALASELWAGRIVPSRHNTSAPDMILRRFAP